MEETKKIAFDFAKNIKKNVNAATVVGLYGELGSGKTTFMKFFAEALGVEETVQSPTFVIMRIYKLQNAKRKTQSDSDLRLATCDFQHLIHIDAYRLESGLELEKLGWNEIIADPGNLICIEWPERVIEVMPEHFVLRFEHVQGEGKGNTQRKISAA